MTEDIENINLKVLVVDTDYYALQAVNSYLAWDRRTRVTHLSESLDDMWRHLDETPYAELPDVILLDSDHIGGADILKHTLESLRERLPDVEIFCLAPHINDPAYVVAAAEGRARAYLLKHEVRLQIAWAIVYARDFDFVMTTGVARATRDVYNSRVFNAKVLPEQRQYPELTDRIKQAIQLCVVEGMPAHLAAHEMGISLHTIRGYVKEGYRIMEAYDDAEYPTDMTPQERAFMRFTAFAEGEDDEVPQPQGDDEGQPS